MFAISSGHTKTIPLYNQMEHIRKLKDGKFTVYTVYFFSLYYQCSKSVECVRSRTEMESLIHFFLFSGNSFYDFAND